MMHSAAAYGKRAEDALDDAKAGDTAKPSGELLKEAHVYAMLAVAAATTEQTEFLERQAGR